MVPRKLWAVSSKTAKRTNDISGNAVEYLVLNQVSAATHQAPLDNYNSVMHKTSLRQVHPDTTNHLIGYQFNTQEMWHALQLPSCCRMSYLDS